MCSSDLSLQLRKRELPHACRIELMSAMLEAMLRNQQVVLARAAP